MSNQLQTKAYVAGATIPKYCLVKPGGNDDLVLPATSAADAAIGVIEGISPDAGERCDVILHGTADVRCGGPVAAGDPLTSDASGRVVLATPAAGVTARVIGTARQSGVAGDVIEVMIGRAFLRG